MVHDAAIAMNDALPCLCKPACAYLHPCAPVSLPAHILQPLPGNPAGLYLQPHAWLTCLPLPAALARLNGLPFPAPPCLAQWLALHTFVPGWPDLLCVPVDKKVR